MMMLTAMVTVTSVMMFSPLLVTLAADFHTTVSLIGQLVAVGGVTWGLLGPLAGTLSDRFGRKPTLIAGLIVYGSLTVAISWAADLPTLFVGRMIACLGGALVATNVQASIPDYFSGRARGTALGWITTAFSLAPVLFVPAVALFADATDWRWAVRLVGMGLLTMALVVYKGLPFVPPTRGTSPGDAFGDLLHNRSVVGLLASNAVERIAFNAVATYLPAFLMQTYVLSMGQVAPVIAAVAVANVAGTIIGGRLVGRVNPVAVFVVAQGAAALALPLLMQPAASIWITVLLAASFGIFNSSSRPSSLWMATQVASSVRGKMMGLYVTTNQAGVVGGAALGGLVIGIGDYGGLGLLSCAFLLVAALLCRFMVRPEQIGHSGSHH